MQRVSGIVSEMEEGSLPLEELITRYEEGIGLVKFCQEKLDAAEQRIQVIARDARGNVETTPFEDQDA